MVRHSAKVINSARTLAAQQHLSYRAISKMLGVSDSSVSSWCRNIPNNNHSTYVESRKVLREAIKYEASLVVKQAVFSKKFILVCCALLYGCEGAKYPSSNRVAFTNADPFLMVSFVNLIRVSNSLEEQKWRVHLQIHHNQDYLNLAEYWSRILKIPANQSTKPTITHARDGKHKDNYLGTCTVKYYDYKLQLKLIGIFEAFMRKSCLLEDIPNG